MIEVLQYFPRQIAYELEKSIGQDWNKLEEIRIRAEKPILLKFQKEEKKIFEKIQIDTILEILQYICDNSIYSYQEQICNGFITIKGGHRVGISGTAVVANGKVINVKYISCLNFRIAKEIIGASNNIIEHILDIQKETIKNTLIVSPPATGKTTILRDIIRQISNGIPKYNFKGKTVGVVDERGELAAMYQGISQNDLGIRTDIMNNISKAKGMQMLIRSMAPEVIVADEIGNKEDIDAINYAICSGVKGIFTAHGSTLEDLRIK